MNQSATGISVVICAYTLDRWGELLSAVASVQAQRLPAKQIIIVIDHNDALLERAQAAFTDALVCANTASRGLSGARNSGIAAAVGAVIAFLDDDAVAAPDWLERLAAAYADPNVLGVGGAIEPRWMSGRPSWFPSEFDWVVGCTYRGMPEVSAAVRNLIGANMSLRREVFAQIGGFTNGIGRIGTRPLGCEETELCIRLHQWQPSAVLRYEPAAQVGHLVPASRANWRYFRQRCYAEGLSKARVAQMVGQQDGLSSERSYVARTLPLGVVQNLAAVLRGDIAGATRAVAIGVGLGTTGLGYLVGRASLWREQRASQPGDLATRRPGDAVPRRM